MVNETSIFRMAGIAGALVVALALVMSFFYPQSLPNLPAGFSSPILALEFAGSLTEVRTLFGDDSELIRRFHIGHYLDMAFLCAYGAFLSLANIGAWQQRGRFISIIGAIAAVIASLADFAENILLMQLTSALLSVAAAPNFVLLKFFVSFKFLAIAFSMACLVPALWPQAIVEKTAEKTARKTVGITLGEKVGNTVGTIYGVATVLAFIATLLTVIGYYGVSTAMSIATVVAWLALWVYLLLSKGSDGVRSL